MAITKQQRKEHWDHKGSLNQSEIFFVDKAEVIIDKWLMGNQGNKVPFDLLQTRIRSNEPIRMNLILAELQKRYSDWTLSLTGSMDDPEYLEFGE